jgi:hypothetical protein
MGFAWFGLGTVWVAHELGLVRLGMRWEWDVLSMSLDGMALYIG